MADRLSKQLPTLKIELNYPRLGIFSMQRALPEELTRWKSVFQVGDRTVEVEAVAALGRPHGLDNDVILAIGSLFIEAGCPEDNVLKTTSYKLRQACGWKNKGESYVNLRSSLFRIYHTGAQIREGYYDPKRKKRFLEGDTYRLIERMRFRDVETSQDVQLDGEGTLHIHLGDQFAESVRSGYAAVLDEVIYRALQQPNARALYTMLEAHRRSPERPDEHVVQLNVALMEWRIAVGIESDRVDSIRRTLTSAHEELIEAGYLRRAEFTGRGKAQRIVYEFGQAARDPDPDLVERLHIRGVARGVAKKYALDYPREFLLQQVERFDTLIRGGYAVRNKGGLMVDLLRQPANYTEEPLAEGKVLSATRPTAPPPPPPDGAEDLATLERQFHALPLLEQAERTVARLTLYLSAKRMTPDLSRRVAAAVMTGSDGFAMQRDVTKALATQTDPVEAIERHLP